MPPRFKHIGDIRIINTLSADVTASGYAMAVSLLESGFQSLAILDPSGAVIGKVTEMDLLRALKAGKDLRRIIAWEIMEPSPPTVNPETPLEQAIEIMEANHLLRLPIAKDGRFAGSVTRHDLLRAWLGLWIDDERGCYSSRVIG